MPTALPRLIAAGFGLLGACGFLMAAVAWGRLAWWAPALGIGLGGLFMAGAVLLMRRLSRPTFDLPTKTFQRRPEAARVSLADLRAVQLVPYRVEAATERERYWSCELDLVHEDGRRTCVLSHGHLDGMRDDAAQLAAFLGVPLWDGTQPR